jgi:hypothetical protein
VRRARPEDKREQHPQSKRPGGSHWSCRRPVCLKLETWPETLKSID